MCELYIESYEPFGFYRETSRKARKEHKCEVCKGPIRPGETYTVVSFMTEGYVASEKVCPTCQDDKKRFEGEHSAYTNPSGFTGMLAECLDYGSEEDQTRWQPVWDRIVQKESFS